MRGISNRFVRVVALDDVDFDVRENEFMGLVGNNESGTSTLIEIHLGYLHPDAGTIHVNSEQVTSKDPGEARKYGIETVYQDLALVNEMAVAANISLARAPDDGLPGSRW